MMAGVSRSELMRCDMYLERLSKYVNKQAGVEFDEVTDLFNGIYAEYHKLAQPMIDEVMDIVISDNSISSVVMNRILDRYAESIDSSMFKNCSKHIADTCDNIQLVTKNITKSNHTKTVTKFQYTLFQPNFVTQDQLNCMVTEHFKHRIIYVATIVRNKISKCCDVNLSAQDSADLMSLLCGRTHFRNVAHMAVLDLDLYRAVYKMAQMGFSRYRLTTVFDHSTSGICYSLNGATFSVESAMERLREKLYMNFDDMVIAFKFPTKEDLDLWINNRDTYDYSPFSLPPFHPFCRTIIEPYEF